MRRIRTTTNKAQQGAATVVLEEPPDRRRLCEEMLQQGFVQSFVDFFYLTHRPDPALLEQRMGAAAEGEAGPETDEEVAKAARAVRDIDVPSQEMIFIRDNLAHAEAARRKGETALVYSAFSNLANYFQDQSGDPKTGVYFFEKCHEIARLTGDHRGEMAANHDLGLAHAHVGDNQGATRYHERHFEMARALDDDRELRIASKQLVGVYRKAAEDHEDRGDVEATAFEFGRCLEAARRAGDAPSEARAALSLGRTLVLRGEDFATEAIRTLEGAELLCRELGDAQGEGRACAALAAAWRAKGDDEKARDYLEDCLEHAVATEDLTAQATACRTLGAVHAAQHDFPRAVELLDRNFKIALQLQAQGQASADLVDQARVDLGIAIGNATLGRYLRALKDDFPALLAWKNAREPLPSDGDDDEA